MFSDYWITHLSSFPTFTMNSHKTNNSEQFTFTFIHTEVSFTTETSFSKATNYLKLIQNNFHIYFFPLQILFDLLSSQKM